MPEPRVVILGAGPAGVGAACQLRRLRRAQVTVVEQNDYVGGNSGSFDLAGQRVDFGSHRLHPACDPEILTDIREFLGNDLLDRPRHGRIRLRGKWIHFPLKPLDLLLRLDRGFAFGVASDMAGRALPGRVPEGDTFASVLQANLGRTICRHFYFPYARKIWGGEPESLSAIQARRRVSAGSFGKLLRKVFGGLPGVKPVGFSHFYYPRGGYGQISEVYAERARAEGAEFLMGWRVERLEQQDTGWRVEVRRGSECRTVSADYVWSTIPIPLLARGVSPQAPTAVRDAAGRIDYRAMLLVYLELPVGRFTEFDAHYFPDPDIAMTRLSEPKNYAALGEPRDSTVLCAELPCAPDDRWWTMSDAELGQSVAGDLARAGIPLPATPRSVTVKRLRHAYPIYRRGYEVPFATLDSWVESLPRLLSYGRQGLFAHDNTHHALYMAYCAAECLENGAFDAARWSRYREVFATHVVED